MHPILVQLGPVTIRTYGLLLSLSFLLGILFAHRRARARGVDPAVIYDLAIVIILSAVVGSRAYYVATHWADYAADPVRVLRVWEGGLSMYGGVLLSILTTWLYFRRKRMAFLPAADIIAPPLALGVAMTRVGCYFNGCCFGEPTSLLWGMLFPSGTAAATIYPNFHLHPTQLYSSLSGLVILLLLLWGERRPRGAGFTFGLFLLLYPLARFGIDFVRYYEPGSVFMVEGVRLTLNQAISAVLLLAGARLVWTRRSAVAPVAAGLSA